MGLRASGKTTLGRVVAARVGGVCVDLDDVVVESLGVSDAKEAFARFGEAGFRTAETRELGRVLGAARDVAGGGVVVALGGGTPTAPGAKDVLRGAVAVGSVVLVYLHAEPGLLAARLGGVRGEDRGRPSLTGADVVDEVGAVYAARDGLYRSLAGASGGVVEVGGVDADAAVCELLSRWGDGARGGDVSESG